MGVPLSSGLATPVDYDWRRVGELPAGLVHLFDDSVLLGREIRSSRADVEGHAIQHGGEGAGLSGRGHLAAYRQGGFQALRQRRERERRLSQPFVGRGGHRVASRQGGRHQDAGRGPEHDQHVPLGSAFRVGVAAGPHR